MDLTNIVTQANMEYHVSIDLSTLNPGQYQGLFLENMEKILVQPQ